MTTGLRELLALEPRDRTEQVHHLAFDDFVRSAGGDALANLVPLPEWQQNADYLVPTPVGSVLIELKQLTSRSSGGSIFDYVNQMAAEGQIRSFRRTGDGRIHFNDESMSRENWTRIDRKFRQSILKRIGDAYRQLRTTSSYLDSLNKPVAARGIWLHNSGDLHLPIDLLTRQASVHVAKEWKNNRFRSLDFVIISLWDLWENPRSRIGTFVSDAAPRFDGRPPFMAHSMFRSRNSVTAVAAADAIRDAYFSYAAESYGAVEVLLGTGKAYRFPDRIPHVSQLSACETALVAVPAIPPAPDPAPRQA